MVNDFFSCGKKFTIATPALARCVAISPVVVALWENFDMAADTNGDGPDIGGDAAGNRSKAKYGAEGVDKTRDMAGIGERTEFGGYSKASGEQTGVK